MGYSAVFWISLVVGLLFAVRWMQRRGWIDLNGDRIRRGTGHAALGLQEFIQPSVEHVIRVQDSEQANEDDREGDDPRRPPPPPFRLGT